MLLRSVSAIGCSRIPDCRWHEHSRRAQQLPAALPAQACRSRSSASQALDLSLRQQQPLASLAGRRPCRALSACTALQPAADFASVPSRYGVMGAISIVNHVHIAWLTGWWLCAVLTTFIPHCNCPCPQQCHCQALLHVPHAHVKHAAVHMRTSMRRRCGRRQRRWRLAARLSALDDDDPDDGEGGVSTEDEDDDDDEAGAAALHDDEDDDPIVPLGVPRGGHRFAVRRSPTGIT